MHITVQKKTLQDLLNASTQAVNPKTPINVIQGVLLKVQNDTLQMTGTDLDITITSIGKPDEIFDEGEVVIPAKRLNDLVKNLPDGSISLETKEESIELRYGTKQKSTIKTFPADEFPITEQPDPTISVKFNTNEFLNEFLNAVNKVYFAATDDPFRPIFTGILFNFTPFGLDLVATDTHRLNIVSVSSETEEKQVIVPKKQIEKILRLCKKSGELTISAGESIIQFATDNVLIQARQITGKFPDYTKIIPKEFPTKCEVNTKELLGSLIRASFIVPITKQAPVVNLSMRENTLTVTAYDDSGQLNEVLDCRHTGPDLDIAFNTEYLIDLLSVIDSENVTIKFSGNICYIKHDNFCSIVVAVILEARQESA